MVTGPVQASGFLIASGLAEGRAIALPLGRLGPEFLTEVAGRAWTASADGSVRAVVGINPVGAGRDCSTDLGSLAMTLQRPQSVGGERAASGSFAAAAALRSRTCWIRVWKREFPASGVISGSAIPPRASVKARSLDQPAST